jgi:hypothetical protein
VILINKPEDGAIFLRWGCYRWPTGTNVAFLSCITRPGRTTGMSKYLAQDFMYSGHGSAEWTNVARAVLTIENTQDPGIFGFRMAKRAAG